MSTLGQAHSWPGPFWAKLLQISLYPNCETVLTPIISFIDEDFLVIFTFRAPVDTLKFDNLALETLLVRLICHHLGPCSLSLADKTDFFELRTMRDILFFVNAVSAHKILGGKKTSKIYE